LEALKSASIGKLDDTRRHAAIALIEETGATGAIPDHVVSLLRDVPALPPRTPGAFARFGTEWRDRYRHWSEQRWFGQVVSTALVILAVASLFVAVSLADDHARIRGVAEWATVISSLVSGVFYITGAVVLRRSRLDAYRWFDRGLLVGILVTQVFTFQQEQLTGVIGLVFVIALWVMVRSAIRVERERESIALEAQAESATQPVS
jgi:hypothetical protein